MLVQSCVVLSPLLATMQVFSSTVPPGKSLALLNYSQNGSIALGLLGIQFLSYSEQPQLHSHHETPTVTPSKVARLPMAQRCQRLNTPSRRCICLCSVLQSKALLRKVGICAEKVMHRRLEAIR